MTGALGTVGQQQKRGAELYAKLQNAKGGILGRPIELLIEDTAGNPANCVRKAQEMVERRDCRLLTGITLSSEALAVVPKLAEWDAIFISSDNGDGRLTAESLVPNFFRANISGPMGTRAVSLYLRNSKLQKFYGLGLDYAWGHNSVQVFEQEALKSKKEFLGKVFAPTGTKDYSPYITKIRQSGADAVFLVTAGRRQQRVPVPGAAVPPAREGQAADRDRRSRQHPRRGRCVARPDRLLALQLQLRSPAEQRVRRLVEEGTRRRVPDTFEGEQWQCMKVFEAGITKAGGIEAAKLRPALEDIEIESVKGKVFMRKCDHQGVQQGFMVEVVKKPGFDTPVPEVIATFPGDSTTPTCNTMTFKD